MIKSYLIHLSMNMWEDNVPASLAQVKPEDFYYYANRQRIPKHFLDRAWSNELQCQDSMWRKLTEKFAACGGNMLIVDIGDGIVLQGHPEIAVSGAWSRKKWREEAKRCRDLGLELIPKFNFSSCHDAWMRQYSRMLSTPEYYRFCYDIIAEAAELFDAPRFFHIGMDEENIDNQKNFEYAVVRQGRLWWSDLNFYFEEVRKVGARPWMWSDKLWTTPDEEYAAHIPLDVIQSNWYYSDVFEFPETPEGWLAQGQKKFVDAYRRLNNLGYDQIPVGSNWAFTNNYGLNAAYCERTLPREKLLGFGIAPWYATSEDNAEILLEACDQVKAYHGGTARGT